MHRFRTLLACRTESAERGQVLVIVGGGLIVFIAMVGLVIDGGYAWGQQRQAQNAADAVAKAGNVPILEWIAGDTTITLGDVGCAVERAEQEAGAIVEEAEFTDFAGNLIGLPVPDCGTGGTLPDAAQGVKATAIREFNTFLMPIVGIDELTARADATAVVGPVPGLSIALPVTFPQTLQVCDSAENVYSVRDWGTENVDGGPPATAGWDPYEILPPDVEPVAGNLAIVPLCGTGPGSVGWLDYGCGNLADSISDPCEDLYIHIPDWILTQTGNVNCCEDELGAYHGNIDGVYEPDLDQIVKLPIHRETCEDDAGTTGTGTARVLNPCITGEGEGNNLWYGVEFWVGFALDSAHVQGADTECQNSPGTPQLVPPVGGGVGCLKGWFVERIGHPDQVFIGELDPGAEGPFGITLIN